MFERTILEFKLIAQLHAQIFVKVQIQLKILFILFCFQKKYNAITEKGTIYSYLAFTDLRFITLKEILGIFKTFLDFIAIWFNLIYKIKIYYEGFK